MKETDSKMNILVVHNYYQIPGGEDTVVQNEREMLQRHGHKVVLYTRDNSEIKQMGILRRLLLPFLAVFSLKTYHDVTRLIKAERIQIVHVHNTLNLVSPSVYYAARACGVPVVQTVHNFRLQCPGATFCRDGHICEDCVRQGLLCAVKHGCYRGSRLQTLACVVSTWIHRMAGIYGKINYICLTEFNRRKLLQQKQILPGRVFVKPNFAASAAPSAEAETMTRHFVFAGRLDRMKGIDLLLEAWKLLGPDAPKLVVCGTGPMEDWCRQYIREHRLENVEMAGFLPNEQTRELIGSAKALILPTRWYEGFPMAVVEAFSAGTPVVVQDLGNAGSLVEEGVTGVKYTEATPEQLADAVRRLDRYRLIRQTVRKVYEEKYTPEKNYEELMEIYNAVIRCETDRTVRRK